MGRVYLMLKERLQHHFSPQAYTQRTESDRAVELPARGLSVVFRPTTRYGRRVQTNMAFSRAIPGLVGLRLTWSPRG